MYTALPYQRTIVITKPRMLQHEQHDYLQKACILRALERVSVQHLLLVAALLYSEDPINDTASPHFALAWRNNVDDAEPRTHTCTCSRPLRLLRVPNEYSRQRTFTPTRQR